MGRYRAIFDGQGLKAEFDGEEVTWLRPGAYDNSAKSKLSAPMVIRDIDPYKSMITGEMITGRKQHRDHLKAHGCIEVGNDTSHIKAPTKPVVKSSRREVLTKRLGDMSDMQANNLLNTMRKDLKK